MTRVDVAIGIVVRGETVLICRRKPGGHLGGYWEFPGGKCQTGETVEECLVRELREETGLVVQITQPLPEIDFSYPDRQIRLHPFICQAPAGEAQALAAEEIRWVPASALIQYPFPPANDRLLEQLVDWVRGQGRG